MSQNVYFLRDASWSHGRISYTYLTSTVSDCLRERETLCESAMHG
jgi:hypothetical protein